MEIRVTFLILALLAFALLLSYSNAAAEPADAPKALSAYIDAPPEQATAGHDNPDAAESAAVSASISGGATALSLHIEDTLPLQQEKEPAQEAVADRPPLPDFRPNHILPIVRLPPARSDIDPDKPMIALTFDDGPSIYTPEILDLVEKYEIRVTFCVVGKMLKGRDEIVERAAGLGCEIIGHSWDHSNMTKLSAEKIQAQLLDTKDAIEAITGIETFLFRPPYGAINDRLKEVSRKLGMALITWSVDPRDWETRDAQAIYDAVMEDAADRSIVLSHDLYETTVEAMEMIIPGLLANEYQFVTVSELLSFNHRFLRAGNVYRGEVKLK